MSPSARRPRCLAAVVAVATCCGVAVFTSVDASPPTGSDAARAAPPSTSVGRSVSALASNVGAVATEPATRTGTTLATDANGCGFRAGLWLDSVADERPELLLHRFDGNVHDDPRYPLPEAVGRFHQVLQRHDCSSVLLVNFEAMATQDAAVPYFIVDMSTGEVTTATLPDRFQPVGQDPIWNVSPRPDGRYVGWVNVFREPDAPDGEFIEQGELIDLLTGETVEEFDTPELPYPSAFSDDGSILATMNRQSDDMGEPLIMSWRGVDAPFNRSSLDVFPGRNYRVDLSPSGELAVAEGPIPGRFVSRVVNQDGDVIIDFSDDQRTLHATFISDDELILCRFDGAYLADLFGNETLIEAFPQPETQPFEDFDSVLFSVENSACVQALESANPFVVYESQTGI